MNRCGNDKLEADHGLISLKKRVPYSHLKVLEFSQPPLSIDWCSFPCLDSIVILANTRSYPESTSVDVYGLEIGQVVTSEDILQEVAKTSLGFHGLSKSISNTAPTYASLVL